TPKETTSASESRSCPSTEPLPVRRAIHPSRASITKATGKRAVPSQKNARSRPAQKRMNARIAPAPQKPFSSVTRSASRKVRSIERWRGAPALIEVSLDPAILGRQLDRGGRGGRRLAGAVGAGAGHRAAEAGDQRARERVRRLPHGHTTVGDQRRGEPGAGRQRDGQRARPVAPHELGRARRDVGAEAVEHRLAIDQHGDGLLAAPLEGAQALERGRVEGVDAEAVERLRRIRHHLAAPERGDSGLDGGVGRQRQLFVSARTSASLSRTFFFRDSRSSTTFAASTVSESAAICAAKRPAFSAPLTATVATGIPGGICTVESSESNPLSAPLAIGTPITGRVVCAATAPAKWAAPPAPQMNALTPRRTASFTKPAVSSGVRCADRTRTSTASPSF